MALLAACGTPVAGLPTTVTVHATETVRAAPDLAIVTVGVVARGATAAAANQEQARRMAAVLAAVKAAGVADEDVQTTQVSLQPQYAYAEGAPPRIAGFEARNMVSVRVTQLDRVGAMIDAVVADGGNEVQGISFGFRDPEAARAGARTAAMQAALQRAGQYAEAAGLEVDRVLSIVEGGGAAPPMPFPVAMDAVRAQTEAVSATMPGQIESEASVTVVVALRR